MEKETDFQFKLYCEYKFSVHIFLLVVRSLLVGDMVNIGLIKGDRYVDQNIFMLLLVFFSLDHAQTTIDFKMCFETDQ